MSPVVWKGTEKSTINENHELAQYLSLHRWREKEEGGGRSSGRWPAESNPSNPLCSVKV